MLSMREQPTSSTSSSGGGTPATSTGAFALYTEDAEIRTGPHWPEQAAYRGREAIRETSEEWAPMWEGLQVEIDTLEEYGDKVGRHRALADARRG